MTKSFPLSINVKLSVEIPSPNKILFSPKLSMIVSFPSPRLNTNTSFNSVPTIVSSPSVPSPISISFIPRVVPSEKEIDSILFSGEYQSFSIMACERSSNATPSSLRATTIFEPNALNIKSSAVMPSPNFRLSYPPLSSMVSIPSPRSNRYVSLPSPPISLSSPLPPSRASPL